MKRRLSLILFICCMSLAPLGAWACGDHLYLDPSKLGFFGGAVARMAGLTPPAPVFDLEHASMMKATVGEESEFLVNYSRPFFSKNVYMEFSGTANVELLQRKIPLEDRDGIVTIPFRLNGSGFDSITLTVRGEHKGKSVLQRAQIYIRAKPDSPKQDLQVSER
jgi:hypothetical protein